MLYSLNPLIFKQKNKPIHDENRLISIKYVIVFVYLTMSLAVLLPAFTT